MDVNNVFKFLFSQAPEGFHPQMGIARADKTAAMWMPGNSDKKPEDASKIIDSGKIKYLGSTGRAFLHPFKNQKDQQSFLCWIGIDIDGKDNPNFTHDELIEEIKKISGNISIRTSCGGAGVHLFRKLKRPIKIPANVEPAVINRFVRKLNSDLVEKLVCRGIHVCQYDNRMFWLTGGLNRWVRLSQEMIEAPDFPEITESTKSDNVSIPTSGGVKEWVRTFQTAGILGLGESEHYSIYIGDFVNFFTKRGIVVKTKSPCSGNGKKNGFLDVGPDWIGLWSWADKGYIWCYSDTDYLFEGTN